MIVQNRSMRLNSTSIAASWPALMLSNAAPSMLMPMISSWFEMMSQFLEQTWPPMPGSRSWIAFD